MRRNQQRFFALTTLFFMLASIAFGGDKTSIRGIGMGGTVTALSHGLDAVGANPANLGLKNDWTVELDFVHFGVYVSSDFLRYDTYTDYFTGRETVLGRVPVFLDDAAKREILSTFDNSVGRLNIGFETRIFGIAARVSESATIAFSIREQARGLFDLPKEYAEFLLVGNPIGSSYDLSGLQLGGTWTRSYDLSIGFEIPLLRSKSRMHIGVAAKLINGFAHFNATATNSRLTTEQNGSLTTEIHVLSQRAGGDFTDSRKLNKYGLFLDPAGTGFGVDVGVRASINDFLSVGLSVTDIGSIHWTDHTRQSTIDTSLVIDDLLSEDQRKVLDRVLSLDERPTSPFDTPLPTIIRLGFAVELGKVPQLRGLSIPLLVGFDYTQGIEDLPGSSKQPKFSTGVEYKPLDAIRVWSGISLGGAERAAVSFGLGFKISALRFSIATENFGWLFSPGSFSHGSLAAGLSLSF